ncbi:probable glycosyltransferase At5g03795 isoform X1 [Nymphaea colorata]|nr:probable glycosyltransferase At5g03795 isoform X1 [Nymphaea colorata]XP_031484598.1 probable glycosyltransferase At5g03795 isoform X1 [Nymphaea colorata]XP_031484599.1 probable glycosyltransferase At5g03795 isoform X1 [Nymphaea colorata]XP_031484601.1 probable glycosyltransferase At5g03795 isoform X1 [Nymphaea colorata]XP_031484602.1 probable glycosyltransferase At5g03795 isoform X1 [Nymphaea colorata]
MEFHPMHWRFETKKIILVIAIVTTAGAVLQTCSLPHPAAFRPLFSVITVTTFETPNNTTRKSGTVPSNVRDEQLPAVSFPVNQPADQATRVAPQAITLFNSTISNTTSVTSPNTPPSDDGLRVSDFAEPVSEIVYENNGTAKNSSKQEASGSSLAQNILEGSRMSNSRSNFIPIGANRNKTIRPKNDIPKSKLKAPTALSFPKRTRADSRTKNEVGFMPPDQALLYAKHEIQNAPIVTDDPDLHPPIFRNVSTFKRSIPNTQHFKQSYELMEKILKVYIYPDGERPIFHTPELKGIYASEGWFMKLMEENRQFVVKDPEKAHLFYLPYGSHQLELALYVPNSHNMRPLSIYLRDYVNTIASKYRFWNRTRGADHFLVACHDWGPYTTKEHEELCHNTIKALCNADLSEGFFVRGKDVSLPETTIRTPKRPLRYLGGRPVSQRSILAFFAGNMHGRVRPVLLKYWSDKDEDMKIYGPLPNRVSRQMSYVQHMKSSKFCICPMGYEVNSPRIVEAIYNECVPVIIADNFVLPFDDILNWSEFSVVVAEKDIPKLKDILMAIPLRRYIALQKNVKQVQKHFLWHSKPVKYDIFHMILHSVWFNRLNQIQS